MKSSRERRDIHTHAQRERERETEEETGENNGPRAK